MNDRIQEIRERQDAATSGPWQAEGREIWRRGESYTANIGGHVWIADVEHAGNKDFIAHAPSDIAYLLAEVERLQYAIEAALCYLDQERYRSATDELDTALSHLKG